MGPFYLTSCFSKKWFIIFKDLEEGITTRQIVDESTGFQVIL